MCLFLAPRVAHTPAENDRIFGRYLKWGLQGRPSFSRSEQTLATGKAGRSGKEQKLHKSSRSCAQHPGFYLSIEIFGRKCFPEPAVEGLADDRLVTFLALGSIISCGAKVAIRPRLSRGSPYGLFNSRPKDLAI